MRRLLLVVLAAAVGATLYATTAPAGHQTPPSRAEFNAVKARLAKVERDNRAVQTVLAQRPLRRDDRSEAVPLDLAGVVAARRPAGRCERASVRGRRCRTPRAAPSFYEPVLRGGGCRERPPVEAGGRFGRLLALVVQQPKHWSGTLCAMTPLMRVIGKPSV
jgi:hypothetical protein